MTEKKKYPKRSKAMKLHWANKSKEERSKQGKLMNNAGTKYYADCYHKIKEIMKQESEWNIKEEAIRNLITK